MEKSRLDAPRDQIAQLSPAKLALLAKRLREKLPDLDWLAAEPIAIVGMGCRFPGGVNNPEQFARLLEQGREAVADVPPSRWDAEGLYDPDFDAPGKIVSKRAALLENITGFDPEFFGISPREASSLDPQQRLLLEVAWEAVENAAYAPDQLLGQSGGVFIGIGTTTYAELQTASGDLSDIGAYFTLGSNPSTASGRLSHTLGLTGPALTVNTACSSSLVAVHLACQSLRNRECELALAGGVGLLLSPAMSVNFSRARMLSPRGRCHTFDNSADGFVRGEGCGVVVLKLLSDAITDGDYIHAAIRGSATNQDGRSGGLTVPNGTAQRAVLNAALDAGGVLPKQVAYVEASSTGSSLGDPIELQALGDVYGRGREPGQPLLVGSVKTNIGHLEVASGMASLIKTVLAFGQASIPRQLHFQTPNAHVPWNELALKVVDEPTPWPQKRRLAGVSAFGFSGTNAHVVLEAPPERDQISGSGSQLTTTATQSPTVVTASNEPDWELLPLSAKTPKALDELSVRYAEFLTDHTPELSDVSFTAGVGRNHGEYRRVVLATDRKSMVAGLQDQESTLSAVADKAPAFHVFSGHASRPAKLALLFTGQGVLLAGTGQQLLQTEPVFRDALEACESVLADELDYRLHDLLYGDQQQRLDSTRYAQPVLMAVQCALVRLWEHWGLQPAAVMGHSVGEFSAACVAGVLSWEDGLRLVAARGRLMEEAPPGVMLSVFAAGETVEALVADEKEYLSIAAYNGPAQTVVAGEEAAMQRLEARLGESDLSSRRLPVSRGFHSPTIEGIVPRLAEEAKRFSHHRPQLTWVSNLFGRPLTVAECRDEGFWPDYWVRHARHSVRFAQGLQSLADANHTVFLEVGPQPVLTGLGRQCLDSTEFHWLTSLNRAKPDRKSLLHAIAQLYTLGHTPRWENFFEGESRRIPLPTYPFQRQRYWFSDRGGIESDINVAAVSQRVTPEGQPKTGKPSTATRKPIEPNGPLIKHLASASVTDRNAQLDDILKQALKQVLELSDEASINPDTQLSSLGLDSLMGLELRQMVCVPIGIQLPVARFVHEITVRELVAAIAEQFERSQILGQELNSALSTPPSANEIAAPPQESNNGQSSPTLYCVSGLPSHPHEFAQLTQELSGQISVQPLTDQGADQSGHSIVRLEGIASRLTQSLLGKSGVDPIHLLGIGLGGILALDIAERLSAVGRQVGCVIVVASESLPVSQADVQPALVASGDDEEALNALVRRMTTQQEEFSKSQSHTVEEGGSQQQLFPLGSLVDGPGAPSPASEAAKDSVQSQASTANSQRINLYSVVDRAFHLSYVYTQRPFRNSWHVILDAAGDLESPQAAWSSMAVQPPAIHKAQRREPTGGRSELRIALIIRQILATQAECPS